MQDPQFNSQAYFNKLMIRSKSQEENRMKAMKLTNYVVEKMERSIIVEEIVMPEEAEKKGFEIEKKRNVENKTDEAEVLKKIEDEKQSLINKIKELAIEEQQLKLKVKSNSCSKIPNQKIVYSKQEHQKFMEAVRSHRRFQKDLENKDKMIAEMHKEQKFEEMRISREYEEKQKDEKKQEILKNIKKMEENSKKRKEVIKEAYQKYKEMNANKYLYQRNEITEKLKNQSQNEEYQQKLKESTRKYRVTLEEIEHHQQKHNQTIQLKTINKQLSISNTSIPIRSKSYSNNYFQIIHKARTEQQRAEEESKLQSRHEMQERIKRFKERILNDFAPKMSNESKFKPKLKPQSIRSLSNAEMNLKGMLYLEHAKRTKDFEKEKQKQSTLTAPPTKQEYKNYLKDIKVKPYETAETKFNSFMHNKRSFSDLEEAKKAVYLAENLGYKSKLPYGEQMIMNMRNKIDLLKALKE